MHPIEKVFEEGVIIKYPEGMPPEKLTHEYKPERMGANGPIPFEKVVELHSAAQLEVNAWYERTYGRTFNPFKMEPGEVEPVRRRYREHPSFREAFRQLGLDPDAHTELSKVCWWNEVAAGELDHSLSDDSAHVVFGPRHSIETQVMREGLVLPIKNVTVAGIVVTAPGDGCDSGYIMIGLRGGHSWPNTYHITAGALKATEAFRNENASIYDVFAEQEAKKEFGLAEEDIDHATVFGRFVDWCQDMGPAYVFHIQSKIRRGEIHQRWQKNVHIDKGEHDQPVYVENNPDAIRRVVSRVYRGREINRPRGDDDRGMLHLGALSLGTYAGMDVDEIRALYVPGDH